MRPAVQDKIMQSGCLVLLVAPVGGIIFAALRQWEYAIGWLALVGIWVLVSRRQAERDEARLQELLRRAFASRQCPPPMLNPSRGSHYGYPAFTLVFDSPAHQTEAERSGAIVAFKEILQQRYAHVGGSTNPFNADLAIELRLRGGD